MERTYWYRQTPDKPLYPDLLWSRPENKRLAGKLLVVGGNIHGFAAAGTAYGEAVRAGVGTVRVVLPDSLQKTVGRVLEAGEYVPSTPSGSFARQTLAELLDMSAWSDATLLAGDFGRNSETAVMLEQFLAKCPCRLALTKDAADYFVKSPAAVLERSETLLVVSFAQLQKLAASAHFRTPFTFDMDFLHLIDALHDFTRQYPAAIIVKHLETIFAAVGGQVSSTKLERDIEIWRVPAAAHATVWWLQNPSNVFEALTTSVATTR